MSRVVSVPVQPVTSEGPLLATTIVALKPLAQVLFTVKVPVSAAWARMVPSSSESKLAANFKRQRRERDGEAICMGSKCGCFSGLYTLTWDWVADSEISLCGG